MIERWKAYLKSISDFRQEGYYSDLWKGLMKEFEIKEDELPGIDRIVKQKCRGYNFEKINTRSAKFYNRITALYGGTLYNLKRFKEKFISSPFQRLSGRIKKQIAHLLIKSSREPIYDYHLFDARTIKLLKYLKHRSVKIEKYLQPLADAKKLVLTYNTLKTVYFFDKLLKNCGLSHHPELSIFEIGAGTANLAVLFGVHSLCKNYYIVDLPEMLLPASYELYKYLPDAKQFLPSEVGHEEEIRLDPDRINYILLTPDQISLIPDNSMDLVINIESFGEMEQPVANKYVAAMYRVLRKNGYLFSANRESRIVSENNGVAYFTTYWKYPFLDSDEVILQEYCPMRDFVMGEKIRNINRLARKS